MEDEIEIHLKRIELSTSNIEEEAGLICPNYDKVEVEVHNITLALDQIRYYLKLRK